MICAHIGAVFAVLPPPPLLPLPLPPLLPPLLLPLSVNGITPGSNPAGRCHCQRGVGCATTGHGG